MIETAEWSDGGITCDACGAELCADETPTDVDAAMERFAEVVREHDPEHWIMFDNGDCSARSAILGLHFGIAEVAYVKLADYMSEDLWDSARWRNLAVRAGRADRRLVEHGRRRSARALP